MNKRKVKFLASAREELLSIFAYIAAEDEPTAIKMLERIEARALSLEMTPYMGVELSRTEYPELRYAFRKLSVRPYGIYYFVTQEWVIIAHILHDKQCVKRAWTGRSDTPQDNEE